MSIRPSWMLPLLGSLVLGGCALSPAEPPPPPPSLAPAAFEARIDRLEADLAARCDRQGDLLQEQRLAQRELTADLREVGGQLRGLRAELAARDQQTRAAPTVAECVADESPLSNKELLGRSEWVGLPDVGTYLKARVDSGANTSSLSATEITPFERDGEDWVRFKLGLNEDDIVVEDVREAWIEAPIERRVRVIQATGEESRPVISLLMTLGPLRETVEFTLGDRTHLDYPVLLGRRFLMDIAVVDVAESYLHERPEFPGGRPAEDADVDEANDRDAEES